MFKVGSCLLLLAALVAVAHGHYETWPTEHMWFQRHGDTFNLAQSKWHNAEFAHRHTRVFEFDVEGSDVFRTCVDYVDGEPTFIEGISSGGLTMEGYFTHNQRAEIVGYGLAEQELDTATLLFDWETREIIIENPGCSLRRYDYSSAVVQSEDCVIASKRVELGEDRSLCAGRVDTAGSMVADTPFGYWKGEDGTQIYSCPVEAYLGEFWDSSFDGGASILFPGDDGMFAKGQFMAYSTGYTGRYGGSAGSVGITGAMKPFMAFNIGTENPAVGSQMLVQWGAGQGQFNLQKFTRHEITDDMLVAGCLLNHYTDKDDRVTFDGPKDVTIGETVEYTFGGVDWEANGISFAGTRDTCGIRETPSGLDYSHTNDDGEMVFSFTPSFADNGEFSFCFQTCEWHAELGSGICGGAVHRYCTPPIKVSPCHVALDRHFQLAEIAQKYDSDWMHLWLLNQAIEAPDDLIKDMHPISVGHEYVVMPGDAAEDIAHRFGVSQRKLQAMNRHVCGEVSAGDMLCILPDTCNGETGSLYSEIYGIETEQSKWYAEAKDALGRHFQVPSNMGHEQEN